ncbi:hypothetical protein ElyMa_002958700 [Elysia marginata]|uniref:Uncharacterized protein n=1 Tax=Elysia marginata TaxID=1093978 RepID=A0AAV4I7Y2_9GAST|nr:hypothetical protein ElyMa_002958700 [Elysia marginata]
MRPGEDGRGFDIAKEKVKCQTLGGSAANTNVKVLGLTRPGIEPRTSRSLSECLTARPQSRCGTEHVTEAPVDGSIESKVPVLMRTLRIKRWNKEERLIRLTNLVTAQEEKKNQDLDTGMGGNKQYHDGSQDFEVSGGFDEDQESEDMSQGQKVTLS